jgi:CheY-like chemotaxis protein
MYEAHTNIVPIIERQFAALNTELTLAKSLDTLIQWHQSKQQKYDRFIVNLESLNPLEQSFLFNYLKESNDFDHWLFIRSISQPNSELTELIEQKGASSFLKPITQDKFYDSLREKKRLGSSAKSSGGILEEAWYARFSGHHAHILLVEDNAVNRMVAMALLKKCGFTISIAKDGVEAVEACQKTDFSLVLMDIQMPRMGGIEAMHKIRKMLEDDQRVAPPIIALTANAMEGASEEYMSQGMDDYLTKPIDQERLGKMLGEWLQKS